jgi:hypothetical protein
LKRWSIRQLAFLALAVFLAAGMGLAAAAAREVAAKVVTMSDRGDCQHCPAHTDQGIAENCAFACNATAVAIILPNAETLPVEDGPTSAAFPCRQPDGWECPPDPGPPRTSVVA